MNEQKSNGAFAPFKEKNFRALWIGGFVSNIGTWMQNIGVSWIAAVLSSSPLTISLIQVATAVPSLFLSYPAGVIADRTDRRKLLIWLQFLLFFILLILSGLTQLHYLNISLLITFTFLVGIGSALSTPIWQAITPEVVSAENIKSAIALNGVSFNLSRAIGPAIGGVLLIYGGIQSIFLFNAVSFLALIVSLYSWKNQTPVLKKTSFKEAFNEGLIAVRKSGNFLKLIIRTLAFTAFVSVVFALIPHLSKYEWRQTSQQYTFLWVCLGAGALVGSLFYNRLTELLLSYRLVAISCIWLGICMLLLGITSSNLWHFLLLFIIGIGWIWSMSTLNVLAQLYSPKDLRGRFLAVNITIFQGSIALTSFIWGYVSSKIGAIESIEIAGVAMVCASAVLMLFPMEEPAAKSADKVACTEPILLPVTNSISKTE